MLQQRQYTSWCLRLDPVDLHILSPTSAISKRVFLYEGLGAAQSSPWYGKHGHDLDRISGKDRKVRMVFK